MNKVHQAIKPWPATMNQVSGMKMFVRAVRPSDTQITITLVREWCYGGAPKRAPLKLNSGFTANVNIFPLKVNAMIN